MTRLILLGGPPGVGKSTVLKLLSGRFPKSAILDADDVCRVSEDVASPENKSFGIFNATSVMRGYFGAGCELGILAWVFARAELFQPVLDELSDIVDHSYLLYLVATPASLEKRLIERGEPEKIHYSKTRLELIEQLPYAKVDSSNISAASASDRIADKIQDWIVGAV